MSSDYQPENSPYDFIMNPGTPPPKRPFTVDTNSKNGFFIKIGLIVGGVIAFMVIAAVVINMLTGDKTNTADIQGLAQTQAEIVRVAGKATSGVANNQSVLNFATTTNLTVLTQQQNTIAFLKTKGIKMSTKQLSLKKNAATDTQLQAAQSSSTFDSVFLQVMQKELNSYSDDLQTYYKNATTNNVKKLIQDDYNQLQLLKAQMPTTLSSASSPTAQ